MTEQPDDETEDLGFPYSIEVASFRATDRSGAAIDLPPDPDRPIFIRSKDGDRWPADSFVGYFMVRNDKNIHDFGPPSLAEGQVFPVNFPVDLPANSFHVETDQGAVDVATVTVVVEFRLRAD